MANDGMLLVNFNSLGNAATSIDKALTTMQSQLDDLESEGKKLTASWDGEAKEAYEQRQARWQAAAKDLHQILTNIKSAVLHSTEDYQRTEKQATQRFL
jgi:ESAT-6 family protein